MYKLQLQLLKILELFPKNNKQKIEHFKEYNLIISMNLKKNK